MTLTELKLESKAALDTANAIITAAEQAGRGLTKAESENYETAMAKYKSFNAAAKAREEQNTIRNFFRDGKPGPVLIGAGEEPGLGFTGPFSAPPSSSETRSPEYTASLMSFLRTGGKAHNEYLTVGADGVGGYHVPGSERFTRQRRANGTFPKMNAGMYEGSLGSSDAAGGYAINIPTSDLVVELALPDLGIFDASMVIPTSTDVKVPLQSAFGGSALKTENDAFGETDPALAQITLSAFMCGNQRIVSWELLQDVPSFQAFVVDDLLKAQRIAEGAYLATGTGTGQPLGVFGNTGTGTGSAYELTGTASTDAELLLGSLFDVTATLKGLYQSNASWIMSRATGLAIRRAQMQTNLYIPVVTVDADGTERILGKPVFYDVNAPALPAATSSGVIPILYGDFKQGNIIGVRGGSGINVKILDQPLAQNGQLVILAYRRIDSRIRRSEAMQAVTISHS